MFDRESIAGELGRFADLDSSFNFVDLDEDYIVNFIQQGDSVTLRIDRSGGRVIERRETGERRHASYKGLLASEKFGNLRRFVDAQRALLHRDAPYLFQNGEQLPVFGTLISRDKSGDGGSDFLDRLNVWLSSDSENNSQRALIIDGPAGVGKTHVIRSLMYNRIRRFAPGSAPPILHVQSRGRKLSILNDVIAATLNSMRVATTYEQLPVLARHGLIDIAIDGFDELADPDGYETAWASLRDLIEEINSGAVLILAGRDTFIDAAKVKKSLTKLTDANTAVVHLKTLPPAKAKQWLTERSVDNEWIRVLENYGLFEEGSYALRPFFVLQIERVSKQPPEETGFLRYPLRSLIDALIRREADILTSAIRGLDQNSLSEQLEYFFCEVARDMADGERDWTDEATLALISDVSFGEVVSEEELRMLRHRVSALALLEQDVLPTRRRFPHSEILNFFLCKAYLRLILANDIPKSLRRNILGLDLLETFHDIASEVSQDEIIAFIHSTVQFLGVRTFDDRTRTNLAALLLAAAVDVGRMENSIRISSVTLDESCVRGTVTDIELFDVTIGQLDCRGADLSAMSFVQCSLHSLIGDETSVLPTNFPNPQSLSVVENGQITTTYDASIIRQWIDQRTHLAQVSDEPSHALILLDKLCRMVLRRNWIRNTTEDRAGRALSDPLWPDIKAVLEEQRLLSERLGVGVGGPKSDFFRINHAKKLLEPPPDEPQFLKIRERVKILG